MPRLFTAISLVLLNVAALPAEPQPAAEPARLGLLEAVRITLTNDPVISIQNREIAASRGRLLTSQGQFDSTFAASISRNLENRPVLLDTTPNAFTRLRVDETDYRVSVNKLLHSGVLVSPGVEMRQTDDNFSQSDALDQASVNLLVQIPLLRGFGEKTVGAAERAARLDLEAARLTLQHTLSQRILNTTVAYWGYVAAAQRLEVIRETEGRAQRLVSQVQALIQADEMPKTELDKLSANLANATAFRLSSEQAIIEARQQLGTAMGIPFEQMKQIPPPQNDLPQTSNAPPVLDNAPPEGWIGPALQNRADLSAAEKSRQVEETLLVAARNGLLPRVDVTLKGGYGGADTGSEFRHYFTGFSDHIEGFNGFAMLSFEFPPANRAARGLVVQREAALEQSQIRADELARQIRSEVFVAWNRLRIVLQELQKSEESKRLYETALANEKTKLNLGMATILDALTLEDRLTSAALNYLDARYRYATAIANLRFQTGTFFSGTNGLQRISLPSLITMPAPRQR